MHHSAQAQRDGGHAGLVTSSNVVAQRASRRPGAGRRRCRLVCGRGPGRGCAGGRVRRRVPVGDAQWLVHPAQQPGSQGVAAAAPGATWGRLAPAPPRRRRQRQRHPPHRVALTEPTRRHSAVECTAHRTGHIYTLSVRRVGA